MTRTPLETPPAPTAALGPILHVAERRTAAAFMPLIAETLRGLARQGVHSTLLTNDEELILRLGDAAVGAHLVRDLSGWRAWPLWRYLRRQVLPQPSVVHLWGTTGLGWIRQWTQTARLPLIVHALNRRHHRRLESLRAGPHEWRISSVRSGEVGEVVPGGVRDLPAAFVPLSAPAARPESAICSVLAVTSFAQYTGCAALLEAVAQFAPGGERVQVALLGAGPGIEPVWQKLRELNLGACVSLLDTPQLWDRVLPEVDIVVVPAEEQEYALVALSAMGHAKPVIAARQQRGPWFHEDRTCWMFTPGSATELAYLLARVLEKPAQAAELAASAREYARAHHPLAVLLQRLGELYTEVAQSSRNG
ncbi:MAG: glycosyltransferase [Phycisphaerales bacterium]|nr:glycosyltransferase [Phycisphaerales bacterium]